MALWRNIQGKRATLRTLSPQGGTGSNPVKATMNDVPRRFKLPETSRIAKELQVKECYGVFLPNFGVYVIFSEERGTDEYTGCPEDIDVEWIDWPNGGT